MLAFVAGIFYVHSRLTIDLASGRHTAVVGPHNQIQEDLKDALAENAHAQNYGEWRRSGYTPLDVFANIRALRSASAWADLCADLDALDAESLALFEPAIRTHARAHSRGLRCAAALAARLTDYWAARGAELAHLHGDMPGFPASLVGPRAPTRSTATTGIPLPSVTLPVGTKPGRHQIAITFEQAAGPASDRLARILDSLDQFGAHATFFVTGEEVRGNPSLARQILDRAHRIGSLGWDESDLGHRPVRQSEDELARAQAELRVAGGMPVTLFRYPLQNSGDSAGSGLPSLAEEFVRGHQKMTFLPTDLDPADWKTTDPVRLFRNSVAALDEQEGGTITFRADLEQTAIVIPHFLEELRTRGYQLVSFTEEAAR